jgi:hypothetical protein
MQPLHPVLALLAAGGLAAQSFAPAAGSPIFVGPLAGEPQVADLDRDGGLDVVVACGTCCGTPADPRSGHVLVLRGDGKGGFAPTSGEPVRIGPSVRKVAIGDLDGDGWPDVVAAQHDSYEIVVLRNDGRGGLLPPARIDGAVGSRPHTHDVCVADLDADGALDVVTTNANDGKLLWLRGDGKGSFTRDGAGPIVAGRHPYDVVLAVDVDRDGRPELVAPDLMRSSVHVLRRDPATGTFGKAPGSPLRAGKRPGYVSAGDLDGDGDQDLVVTHDDEPWLCVLRNDGKGGYTPSPGSPFRTPCPVWGSALGDLDADGDLDLVLGGNDAVVLMLGDGQARFAAAAEPPLRAGRFSSYVALADVDADGRLDILATSYKDGTLSVFLATGRPPRPADVPQAFDVEQTLAELFRRGAGEATQRQAWIWTEAAGSTRRLVERMDSVLEKARTSGSERVVRDAHLELARMHELRLSAYDDPPLLLQAFLAGEKHYDAALALDAENLDARVGRALLLARLPAQYGRVDEAVRALGQIVADHAGSSDPLVQRAKKWLGELKR